MPKAIVMDEQPGKPGRVYWQYVPPIAPDAHGLAIVASKGMAITGWKILSGEYILEKMWKDFEEDKKNLDVEPN
jgi:hypothetical protein